MKKLFLLSLALLIAMNASAVDAKFLKKAADKVWSIAPEMFDAGVAIPDSISSQSSAVVICDYDYIDVDYKDMSHRYVRTEVQSVIFTRIMIKLLDSKAVEEYSKHEFGQSAKGRIKYRRTLAETKNAFGARIFKPDGRVVDVDLSKAYDVSDGKKGDKNGKKAIDIPGLEPGDVLDYFTYTETRLEDMNLPPERIRIVGQYPVLNLVVDASFSTKLTVDCKAYNGAPALEITKGVKDRNRAYLHLTDIHAITDTRYVNDAFEYPYYDFFILNNLSPYIVKPKTARAGGIYPDVFAGTTFMDVGSILMEADFDGLKFPGKLKKLIGNYKKSHPDASKRELTDMAWTAANYLNSTDPEGRYSDLVLSMLYCDVIQGEQLADTVGVALLTSHGEPDLRDVISWQQPDYGAYVDNFFYTVNDRDVFLPNEVPVEYQGRNAAYFYGNRKKYSSIPMPKTTYIPMSKSADNRLKIDAKVRITDEGEAELSSLLSLTGGAKYVMSPFNRKDDWIQAQEDWLGIEEGKRYEPAKIDSVEYKKAILEAGDYLMDHFLAADEIETESVSILDRGIVPGHPAFEMALDMKVKEFTSEAGNDMIVHIGKLAMPEKKIEGAQRENRKLNVDFVYPKQMNYTYEIEIPEGYEAHPESVEALTVQVNNKAGMFATGAKLSDDGRTLTLMIRTRDQNAMMSPAAWPLVIELTDVASAFADAQLILEKK